LGISELANDDEKWAKSQNVSSRFYWGFCGFIKVQIFWNFHWLL